MSIASHTNIHSVSPIAALHLVDFRKYIIARFLLTFSIQIQMVIVGWQIYQLTNDPFSLGFIGLVEAIPSLGVALFGGVLADRINRKYLLVFFTSVLITCSIALGIATYLSSNENKISLLWTIYIIIFISGLARGCIGPAIFAFWPQLVEDKKIFSNAVVWNSTVWQISSTLGPAVGGFLIAPLGIGMAYFLDGSILLLSCALFVGIAKRPLPKLEQTEPFFRHLTEGVRFVFNNTLILSALSLDLFAVLFGGAVALLPVYAQEILKVGSFEFGLLKSAMGMGSVAVVLCMAFIPVKKRAGMIMLYSVALFGACMVGFGLSTQYWVSFFFLLLAGIFDGISVVIRGTLVQTHTPDAMKGRVSAVNNIFIGSSNELGAFESGLAARLFGVVNAVVFGGFLAIGITAAIGAMSSKLRKLEFA